MNKEFIKKFKKEREDIEFMIILNHLENLFSNFENEEELDIIDCDIKKLNKIWSIYKKNIKKDKRW